MLIFLFKFTFFWFIMFLSKFKTNNFFIVTLTILLKVDFVNASYLQFLNFPFSLNLTVIFMRHGL